MYPQLGAQLSWAGMVSVIICLGTITSSLASDRLTARFGPGRVTACSVALTAAALFGFSFSTAFWQLCLWAIPYGLGAGSVDAALNNYVALHYESRHMSWLHAMWGVGASVGPVIMGWALAGGSWQNGYRTIGLLQTALTVVLVCSLPLWKRPSDAAEEGGFTPQHLPLPRLLCLPGVREVLLCFFCYCALESTAGMWAASYCVLARSIDAETAASWASLYYTGIMAGRFAGGFVTMKLGDRQMIRLGQAIMAAGVVFILLPLGRGSLLAGLVLLGLGSAPIYPAIIHETPANFGRELSMAMTGVQMAFAYMGSLVMPPLFGLLAQNITVSLYPWYLAVLLAVMVVSAEALHKKTAR